MTLNAKEAINKIDNGEITWDNVYDVKIEGDKAPLKEYAALKNAMQQSLKVSGLNAEFGFLDNKFNPVGNRNISGSITFMGRVLIKYTANKVVDYLTQNYGVTNCLIYQDTDSLISTSKIRLRNLYKVTFEDGSVKYVSKEELERLKGK